MAIPTPTTILSSGIDSTSGQFKIFDPTAEAISGSARIYQNQTIKLMPIIWNGLTTTTSGVATFFPTDDNTSGGNAIFTNVYSIQVSASTDTSTATLVPAASVKLLSSDKKTLTVNSIDGIILIALGATTEFSPDGTTVYATIIGD